MEAGGDQLRWRGMRQQVAGDLLDGELIERHVSVEGLDHPVAIGPSFDVVIQVHAVRVGIAGGIQPVTRPVLAVVRRGHQLIDQLLVTIHAFVRHELLDERWFRRQAREIQRNPPHERARIGFRRGRQSVAFQFRQREAIDRVAHPLRVFYRRQFRPLWLDQ
ncbi:hypothetical protein CfE428DRAFT_0513 [Chthoniobacter flavus Ellin428]|uniref:Uncharacterized protein n=1 Tax=Chthoniobacter flavus Ellin428 TaxID=497964 RepID=B4CV00_9BACT|nr:hypothetical protein CfE428DRAFT_0513 [Chthoniobacter flavus Ellin428]